MLVCNNRRLRVDVCSLKGLLNPIQIRHDLGVRGCEYVRLDARARQLLKVKAYGHRLARLIAAEVKPSFHTRVLKMRVPDVAKEVDPGFISRSKGLSQINHDAPTGVVEPRGYSINEDAIEPQDHVGGRGEVQPQLRLGRDCGGHLERKKEYLQGLEVRKVESGVLTLCLNHSLTDRYRGSGTFHFFPRSPSKMDFGTAKSVEYVH